MAAAVLVAVGSEEEGGPAVADSPVAVAALAAVALRGVGEMNHKRLLQHSLRPAWVYRRQFDGGTRWAIESAIKESESHHRGELRFVAEGPLSWRDLLTGVTARQRADSAKWWIAI